VNTPRRDIGVSSRARIAAFAGAHHLSLFEAALRPECRSGIPSRSARSLAEFCDLLIETGDRGNRSDPVEAVRDLINAIGYESWLRDQTDKPPLLERRLDNVRELVDWIARLDQETPGQALTDLIGRLSLLTSLDTEKEPEHQVRLMTLHGSKGLEFPHVFMVGVEEELLPHRNSLDEGGEVEERRLMYVGITRAQRSLTLSYAQQRRRFGEQISCEPSRFLEELPPELLEWKGQDEEKDYQRTKERAAVHLERLKEMFAD
jgi:ATP-dependent DNA helicase Rep